MPEAQNTTQSAQPQAQPKRWQRLRDGMRAARTRANRFNRRAMREFDKWFTANIIPSHPTIARIGTALCLLAAVEACATPRMGILPSSPYTVQTERYINIQEPNPSMGSHKEPGRPILETERLRSLGRDAAQALRDYVETGDAARYQEFTTIYMDNVPTGPLRRHTTFLDAMEEALGVQSPAMQELLRSYRRDHMARPFSWKEFADAVHAVRERAADQLTPTERTDLGDRYGSHFVSAVEGQMPANQAHLAVQAFIRFINTCDASAQAEVESIIEQNARLEGFEDAFVTEFQQQLASGGQLSAIAPIVNAYAQIRGTDGLDPFEFMQFMRIVRTAISEVHVEIPADAAPDRVMELQRNALVSLLNERLRELFSPSAGEHETAAPERRAQAGPEEGAEAQDAGPGQDAEAGEAEQAEEAGGEGEATGAQAPEAEAAPTARPPVVTDELRDRVIMPVVDLLAANLADHAVEVALLSLRSGGTSHLREFTGIMTQSFLGQQAQQYSAFVDRFRTAWRVGVTQSREFVSLVRSARTNILPIALRDIYLELISDHTGTPNWRSELERIWGRDLVSYVETNMQELSQWMLRSDDQARAAFARRGGHVEGEDAAAEQASTRITDPLVTDLQGEFGQLEGLPAGTDCVDALRTTYAALLHGRIGRHALAMEIADDLGQRVSSLAGDDAGRRADRMRIAERIVGYLEAQRGAALADQADRLDSEGGAEGTGAEAEGSEPFWLEGPSAAIRTELLHRTDRQRRSEAVAVARRFNAQLDQLERRAMDILGNEDSTTADRRWAQRILQTAPIRLSETDPNAADAELVRLVGGDATVAAALLGTYYQRVVQVSDGESDALAPYAGSEFLRDVEEHFDSFSWVVQSAPQLEESLLARAGIPAARTQDMGLYELTGYPLRLLAGLLRDCYAEHTRAGGLPTARQALVERYGEYVVAVIEEQRTQGNDLTWLAAPRPAAGSPDPVFTRLLEGTDDVARAARDLAMSYTPIQLLTLVGEANEALAGTAVEHMAAEEGLGPAMLRVTARTSARVTRPVDSEAAAHARIRANHEAITQRMRSLEAQLRAEPALEFLRPALETYRRRWEERNDELQTEGQAPRRLEELRAIITQQEELQADILDRRGVGTAVGFAMAMMHLLERGGSATITIGGGVDAGTLGREFEDRLEQYQQLSQVQQEFADELIAAMFRRYAPRMYEFVAGRQGAGYHDALQETYLSLRPVEGRPMAGGGARRLTHDQLVARYGAAFVDLVADPETMRTLQPYFEGVALPGGSGGMDRLEAEQPDLSASLRHAYLREDESVLRMLQAIYAALPPEPAPGAGEAAVSAYRERLRALTTEYDGSPTAAGVVEFVVQHRALVRAALENVQPTDDPTTVLSRLDTQAVGTTSERLRQLFRASPHETVSGFTTTLTEVTRDAARFGTRLREALQLSDSPAAVATAWESAVALYRRDFGQDDFLFEQIFDPRLLARALDGLGETYDATTPVGQQLAEFRREHRTIRPEDITILFRYGLPASALAPTVAPGAEEPAQVEATAPSGGTGEETRGAGPGAIPEGAEVDAAAAEAEAQEAETGTGTLEDYSESSLGANLLSRGQDVYDRLLEIYQEGEHQQRAAAGLEDATTGLPVDAAAEETAEEATDFSATRLPDYTQEQLDTLRSRLSVLDFVYLGIAVEQAQGSLTAMDQQTASEVVRSLMLISDRDPYLVGHFLLDVLPALLQVAPDARTRTELFRSFNALFMQFYDSGESDDPSRSLSLRRQYFIDLFTRIHDQLPNAGTTWDYTSLADQLSAGTFDRDSYADPSRYMLRPGWWTGDQLPEIPRFSLQADPLPQLTLSPSPEGTVWDPVPGGIRVFAGAGRGHRRLRGALFGTEDQLAIPTGIPRSMLIGSPGRTALLRELALIFGTMPSEDYSNFVTAAQGSLGGYGAGGSGPQVQSQIGSRTETITGGAAGDVLFTTPTGGGRATVRYRGTRIEETQPEEAADQGDGTADAGAGTDGGGTGGTGDTAPQAPADASHAVDVTGRVGGLRGAGHSDIHWMRTSFHWDESLTGDDPQSERYSALFGTYFRTSREQRRDMMVIVTGRHLPELTAPGDQETTLQEQDTAIHSRVYWVTPEGDLFQGVCDVSTEAELQNLLFGGANIESLFGRDVHGLAEVRFRGSDSIVSPLRDGAAEGDFGSVGPLAGFDGAAIGFTVPTPSVGVGDTFSGFSLAGILRHYGVGAAGSGTAGQDATLGSQPVAVQAGAGLAQTVRHGDRQRDVYALYYRFGAELRTVDADPNDLTTGSATHVVEGMWRRGRADATDRGVQQFQLDVVGGVQLSPGAEVTGEVGGARFRIEQPLDPHRTVYAGLGGAYSQTDMLQSAAALVVDTQQLYDRYTTGLATAYGGYTNDASGAGGIVSFTYLYSRLQGLSREAQAAEQAAEGDGQAAGGTAEAGAGATQQQQEDDIVRDDLFSVLAAYWAHRVGMLAGVEHLPGFLGPGGMYDTIETAMQDIARNPAAERQILSTLADRLREQLTRDRWRATIGFGWVGDRMQIYVIGSGEEGAQIPYDLANGSVRALMLFGPVGRPDITAEIASRIFAVSPSTSVTVQTAPEDAGEFSRYMSIYASIGLIDLAGHPWVVSTTAQTIHAGRLPAEAQEAGGAAREAHPAQLTAAQVQALMQGQIPELAHAIFGVPTEGVTPAHYEVRLASDREETSQRTLTAGTYYLRVTDRASDPGALAVIEIANEETCRQDWLHDRHVGIGHGILRVDVVPTDDGGYDLRISGDRNTRLLSSVRVGGGVTIPLGGEAMDAWTGSGDGSWQHNWTVFGIAELLRTHQDQLLAAVLYGERELGVHGEEQRRQLTIALSNELELRRSDDITDELHIYAYFDRIHNTVRLASEDEFLRETGGLGLEWRRIDITQQSWGIDFFIEGGQQTHVVTTPAATEGEEPTVARVSHPVFAAGLGLQWHGLRSVILDGVRVSVVGGYGAMPTTAQHGQVTDEQSWATYVRQMEALQDAGWTVMGVVNFQFR